MDWIDIWERDIQDDSYGYWDFPPKTFDEALEECLLFAHNEDPAAREREISSQLFWEYGFDLTKDEKIKIHEAIINE